MPDSLRLREIALILFFIAVVFIDRFAKIHAATYFDLNVIHNPGFMFSTLHDLRPEIRVVFISSFYGLALFLFLLAQYMLVKPLAPLRIGLTIFFAGVTGNAMDRAAFGYVIDIINIPSISQYSFNPADVFQWLGLLITVPSLFIFEKHIWHAHCVRSFRMVDRNYQINYAAKLALVSFCACLTQFLFGLTYLKYLAVPANHSESISFVISSGLIAFTLVSITFITGIIISNRSAGAVHGFKLYVEDLMKGEDRPFTQRKGDYHAHLGPLAKKLRAALKK